MLKIIYFFKDDKKYQLHIYNGDTSVLIAMTEEELEELRNLINKEPEQLSPRLEKNTQACMLGSNRDKLDIIAAILTVAKNNWTEMTLIMYRANLNSRRLMQYMDFLVKEELLRASDTHRERRYKTTLRGIELLKDYEKILQWLKR
ncbi:MAG: winged helix-turn-helix domain-containing protein [Candidatus Hodarchaeota archaeon]